jgi:tryptophan synthase alpha chain
VGTALISVLKQSLDADDAATERTVKDVTAYVADLAKGVRGARTGALP